MKPESTGPGSERRVGDSAIEGLSDRFLVALGFLAALALAGILAFGFLRGSGRVDATYGALQLITGVLLVLVVCFLLWRRKIYERLDASKLAVLALGFLIPVVSIESYANLFNPRGYHYYAESERYFQWQKWDGTPLSHEHPRNARLGFPWGEIVTNREGWRGPDTALVAPADTARILALGDSVVFSWGVDQGNTLPAAIEASLAADEEVGKRFRHVEVLNTGNCSFNSVDELIVLKRQGLRYRPDVVLMLAVDNDFADRMAFHDQVEYLDGVGVLDPGLLPLLASTAIDRDTLQQQRSGVAGRVLSRMTFLLKRSFIVTTSAQIARRWRRARRPDAPREPRAPGPGAVARYPFVQEQTAAIKEAALASRDAGIPFVLFTYRMGKGPLAVYLTERLGGLMPIHDLDYEKGEDIRSTLNSRTDSHWNARGTAVFGRKMAAVIAPLLQQSPRTVHGGE